MCDKFVLKYLDEENGISQKIFIFVGKTRIKDKNTKQEEIDKIISDIETKYYAHTSKHEI